LTEKILSDKGLDRSKRKKSRKFSARTTTAKLIVGILIELNVKKLGYPSLIWKMNRKFRIWFLEYIIVV